MKRLSAGLLAGIAVMLLPVGLVASDKTAEKPLVVVRAFTASENTWPYDMKKMQMVTAAEVKSICDRYDVTTDDLPRDRAHYYILEGKVVSWHPGSMHWPVTSRENAEIQFWVTDESGKKVYESTDTIRGGAPNYGNDVGFLLHPFAEKIAHRLKDAKLQ